MVQNGAKYGIRDSIVLGYGFTMSEETKMQELILQQNKNKRQTGEMIILVCCFFSGHSKEN